MEIDSLIRVYLLCIGVLFFLATLVNITDRAIELLHLSGTMDPLNPNTTVNPPHPDATVDPLPYNPSMVCSLVTYTEHKGAILQHPAMLVSTSTWWLNHTKYARSTNLKLAVRQHLPGLKP
ncbi:hypothetical protein J3A83DRAFT_4189133 [Scleroderma citrinum]